MKQWPTVVHQVYRSLRENLKGFQTQGEVWLVMISGGMDSVVLLEILRLLQNSLGIQICLFHVHHGAASESQESYRDQALLFTQKLAAQGPWPFYFVRSPTVLSSEEEMRNFRKVEIQKLRETVRFDRVAFGHHQDDFLETQLMRMIRGAGPRACLSPMSVSEGRELRPLLSISRAELKKLAEDSGLSWLEDPSNLDTRYLRNWLRQKWLVSLEDQCPGALNSLSRSLHFLSQMRTEMPEESLLSDIWHGEGLSRPIFLTLSDSQRGQCLAQYLRKLGVREFNHNQIKEIMKHLDISKLEHRFRAARLEWTLTRELILARPQRQETGL